jgi:hypothetical protein
MRKGRPGHKFWGEIFSGESSAMTRERQDMKPQRKTKERQGLKPHRKELD